jgi:hypothetical protein
MRKMLSYQERGRQTSDQLKKRTTVLAVAALVDTPLNALDADHDFFHAEQSLAQIRLGELLSAVQLYKARCGSWQRSGPVKMPGPRHVPGRTLTAHRHLSLKPRVSGGFRAVLHVPVAVEESKL